MSYKKIEDAMERRQHEREGRSSLRGEIATKAFSGGLLKEDEINEVYLWDICDRHKNDFIVSDKKLLPLIKSIKKYGVGQPVLLTNINHQIDDLKNTLESFDGEEEVRIDLENRLVYLNEQKELGKKYVLVSGHRRFKACRYIFAESNQEILKQEGYEITLDNFEDAYNTLCQRAKKNKEDVLSILNDDNSLYVEDFEKIPASIKTLDQQKEHSLYEDTNLTQREISTFEIILQIRDKIEKTLNSDDSIKFIKQYLGEDANVNYFSKGDLYKSYITNGLGIEKISRPNILKNLKIIENAQTPKLIEYILNGKITINEAETLSRKEYIHKQEELLKNVELGLPLFEQKKNKEDDQEQNTPEAKVLKCALSIEKQIKDLETALNKCSYSNNRKDISKKSNRERLLKKLKGIDIEEFIKKI